jgi:hypothetical protein
MNDKSRSFEDLNTIRRIMEESSRFLSLSGLSGIVAGIIAIAGGVFAYFAILKGNVLLTHEYISGLGPEQKSLISLWLIIDFLVILISAIGVSIFFSYRRSLGQGLKIWTPVSKRMLINMFIPLVTGGILILILFKDNQWQLIVPSMLLFYGLALVSAGKFTYTDVFYLGILEILVGLISALFPVYGLYFWCFGFGFLHIFYGLVMYRKYEK